MGLLSANGDTSDVYVDLGAAGRRVLSHLNPHTSPLSTTWPYQLIPDQSIDIDDDELENVVFSSTPVKHVSRQATNGSEPATIETSRI